MIANCLGSNFEKFDAYKLKFEWVISNLYNLKLGLEMYYGDFNDFKSIIIRNYNN